MKLIIQLKVIPNPELESVILSFGGDAKVLQPESLKEKINAIARKCGMVTKVSRAIMR